jgi:hypothetical protein
MSRLQSRFATLLLMLNVATVSPAHAGRNCEVQSMDPRSVERAMELALKTSRELDASGAQVVFLARAGQDLSRYHLRWSHLGFAYRDSSGTPAVWRVVHKLNQCGTDRGDLYRQGLGEFFMDDLFRYESRFVIPRAEIQERLLGMLQDNRRLALLNHSAYSMVAYPWAQTYQQSNQWAIETMALAAEPNASSRERAQAWLRFKGYQPSELRISSMERLGARIGAANIAFDDHPNDKRFSGRIETVTVESIFDWMTRAGLTEAAAKPLTNR